jgi:hypothetical protein
MIAALFVATNGCYFGLPDVDPWDEARDARRYAGPHPVVAHPPCERWGRYWYGGPMLHKLGRRLERGADGGCFAAALSAVRAFGGVLEHPEASSAWRAFGLLEPPRSGGWIVADWQGGWTCCVEQGHYGHRARKATWLYANGVDIPSLRWGKSASKVRLDQGYHSKEERRRLQRLGDLRSPRLLRAECAATPDEFRDVLLGIARSAGQHRRQAA